MSWSLFNTNMLAISGPQHVTTEHFAWTLASAYHQTISLHFDTMTAGGVIVNNAPKLMPLYQGILGVCKGNLSSHNQVNFVQQIGQHITTYWAGLMITGPTGFVVLTSTGVWAGIPVVQNTNFNIIINAIMMSARTHIMTLQGTYTSTILPSVVSPWSGALLLSMP